MKQIDLIKLELQNEAATTRKMLALVPEGKDDWAPHDKSMKLMPLAIHVAELSSWIEMTLTTDELDFEANPYKHKEIRTNEELLAFFETSLADAQAILNSATESKLQEMWTLRSGKNIHSHEPKWAIIRMSMSQTIHHRAQLGVYLRLLNISLPGSYGPSADQGF